MEPFQSQGLHDSSDASTRVQKSVFASDKMAALKARVATAIGTSQAKGNPNAGHPSKSIGNSSTEQGFHSKSGPLLHGARGNTLFQVGRPGLEGGKGNPYFDESVAFPQSHQKRREPKRLVFNQKGKYIQQASALRRQAALEAMKRRIAEQTRKAGIDDDVEVEKNFVVETPPDIEWWDEGLVDGRSYDKIEDPTSLKIETPDSIITEYIQHPVALEPPQDRLAVPAKPMFLTSKEQAKLRRQRRMAELKEMQAKIRLGLVPAPPPKVKKGNLMRVLGDVAVKDPTAVEARVNREIAERHQKHIDANEERQLTKQQKHEKLANNQRRDADKGICILVFKITSLANGQHRYKISVNAEQLALSGICIMHPKLNLVIVEGGAWSINKFRRLMVNRIDWTENLSTGNRGEKRDQGHDWLQAEDQDGQLRDMSLNECRLIFEGEQKGRVFRKWSNKVCETDAEAREALSRARMDNFWSLAKGHV